MKVFRYLRNLVVFVVVIILAVFIYDGYHSFQGTDRESKAHTTVEKRIEQSEDTLSRTDRIEDKRYYKHGAIDVLGIIRAFYTNTIAGETVEGGSTITQQVVKNLFLSSKRIMSRKVEEAILASEMEHYYSKEEILTMYLNTVYYGHNYYGIYEAAHGYFGTSPSRLTLGQSALLAALPNAPSYLDPYLVFDC